MNNVREYSDDNKGFDFYLDPSLINVNLVKHIGIENLTRSIRVETTQHVITQTIHLDEFTKKTIIPLRTQIEAILLDFRNEEEKKKVVNSIITSINRNIDKIFEYCKSSSNLGIDAPSDENGIVDSFVSLALNPVNNEKLFKDQYGKPYAAIRLGVNKSIKILPINSLKYRRYLYQLAYVF